MRYDFRNKAVKAVADEYNLNGPRGKASISSDVLWLSEERRFLYDEVDLQVLVPSITPKLIYPPDPKFSETNL